MINKKRNSLVLSTIKENRKNIIFDEILEEKYNLNILGFKKEAIFEVFFKKEKNIVKKIEKTELKTFYNKKNGKYVKKFFKNSNKDLIKFNKILLTSESSDENNEFLNLNCRNTNCLHSKPFLIEKFSKNYNSKFTYNNPEIHYQKEFFETGRFRKLFEELEIIGNRRFSQVFKARNRFDQTIYAVKRVFLLLSETEDFNEHFYVQIIKKRMKLKNIGNKIQFYISFAFF